MSEYNLTPGQALDLVASGKKVIWEKDELLYVSKARDKLAWFSVADDTFYCDFLFVNSMLDTKFKEYMKSEGTKLVTWYRPEVTWNVANKQPYNESQGFLYRSKDEYLQHRQDEKVLKWLEYQLPENWDEIE